MSEHHEFEARKVEKVVTTGEPLEYEKEYARKDGSCVPVLLTAFLVRNSNGEPDGLGAIIKDITECKALVEGSHKLAGESKVLWMS